MRNANVRNDLNKSNSFVPLHCTLPSVPQFFVCCIFPNLAHFSKHLESMSCSAFHRLMNPIMIFAMTQNVARASGERFPISRARWSNYICIYLCSDSGGETSSVWFSVILYQNTSFLKTELHNLLKYEA